MLFNSLSSPKRACDPSGTGDKLLNIRIVRIMARVYFGSGIFVCIGTTMSRSGRKSGSFVNQVVVSIDAVTKFKGKGHCKVLSL